jgi:hypothetical protein
MCLAEVMFGKVSGQDAINDAFTWGEKQEMFCEVNLT